MKTIEEMKEYLEEAIDTFKKDPPDSPFQFGYLAALKEVLKNAS